MALRKRKLLAFLIGLAITAVAWAGLETVTHIQDLNASWPLGSDLASTSDDHVRNIKSALKTDFPNFNGTYTSASAPVFAIPSDTNTGMYSVGADDLGFSTNGTLRFDISTTAFTGTLPFRGQDGTANAPAFSFSGDTDTGIFRVGANRIGISVGTAQVVDIASNFFDIDVGPLRIPDGGASTPSFTFFNDTDTGLYRDTNNQIGIALGGATAGQIAKGTFTGTLTGLTTSPTTSAEYVRMGNMVIVYLGSATGTSNSSSFTITGVPAAIQSTNATGQFSCGDFLNNSSPVGNIQGSLGAASGTMTFYVGGVNTGFTASGTKGFPANGTQCMFMVR